MTDTRKKRMSMLDDLARAGAPIAMPQPKQAIRALKAARDAVDSHHIWELDPDSIIDERVKDRLDTSNLEELQLSIETNGQSVPILVRRNPAQPDTYLLVYGRRRLEAIRKSEKVEKVRAIVANLDDDDAVRAQISENRGRLDLSYIERAMFACELIESGVGNQTEVAEILGVSKSSISMALATVEAVGPDLIRAIGAAHGVGRPRWYEMAKAIASTTASPDTLIDIAEREYISAESALITGKALPEDVDPSVRAYEAVEKALQDSSKSVSKRPVSDDLSKPRRLSVGTLKVGTMKRMGGKLKIDISHEDFAQWLEGEIDDVLQELHARWNNGAEG